jgi:hypothetical protein
MCRLMFATGHKQSSVTFLNLHYKNVSILIVTFLFITYVKLPGSKGKGTQIPSHVTAAFTTHSTNTKMLLIGLVYQKSLWLATPVAKWQFIPMQPLQRKITMSLNQFRMEKIELLRDVSSSTTNSMKETTVCHLNKSRQNIVVDGKLYRCNKVRVVGEKNNVVYVKYLQCGMALDKANGPKWKPYNKVKATLSSKKIRCYGTLRAEFSKVHGKEISHYYPKNQAHICYNPTASFGQIPETRVPLMLVFPSQSWNILKVVIDNIKESLLSLSDRHWINQSHCGTARQHIEELSMSK